MKRLITYLKSKDILLIHNLVVDATNGTHGITDYKRFESAVASPNVTFVGQEMYPTVIEKAAALLHAFLTTPVFADKRSFMLRNKQQGVVNKGTAMICCMTFLELNGYVLEISISETVEFASRVEKERLTIDQVVEWINNHCHRLRR